MPYPLYPAKIYQPANPPANAIKIITLPKTFWYHIIGPRWHTYITGMISTKAIVGPTTNQ